MDGTRTQEFWDAKMASLSAQLEGAPSAGPKQKGKEEKAIEAHLLREKQLATVRQCLFDERKSNKALNDKIHQLENLLKMRSKWIEFVRSELFKYLLLLRQQLWERDYKIKQQQLQLEQGILPSSSDAKNEGSDLAVSFSFIQDLVDARGPSATAVGLLDDTIDGEKAVREHNDKRIRIQSARRSVAMAVNAKNVEEQLKITQDAMEELYKHMDSTEDENEKLKRDLDEARQAKESLEAKFADRESNMISEITGLHDALDEKIAKLAGVSEEVEDKESEVLRFKKLMDKKIRETDNVRSRISMLEEEYLKKADMVKKENDEKFSRLEAKLTWTEAERMRLMIECEEGARENRQLHSRLVAVRKERSEVVSDERPCENQETQTCSELESIQTQEIRRNHEIELSALRMEIANLQCQLEEARIGCRPCSPAVEEDDAAHSPLPVPANGNGSSLKPPSFGTYHALSPSKHRATVFAVSTAMEERARQSRLRAEERMRQIEKEQEALNEARVFRIASPHLQAPDLTLDKSALSPGKLGPSSHSALSKSARKGSH